MIIDVEAWGALKDNTTTKVNKLISTMVASSQHFEM